MQNNNISHRDIKPENLIVMEENNLYVKIADLGSCRKQIDDKINTNSFKGTVSYSSPEMLRSYNTSGKDVNPYKSDVYSLGLTFLYFITFKKFS